MVTGQKMHGCGQKWRNKISFATSTGHCLFFDEMVRCQGLEISFRRKIVLHLYAFGDSPGFVRVAYLVLTRQTFWFALGECIQKKMAVKTTSALLKGMLGRYFWRRCLAKSRPMRAQARNSKVYLRSLLPNNFRIGKLVRKSLFIPSMCEIG